MITAMTRKFESTHAKDTLSRRKNKSLNKNKKNHERKSYSLGPVIIPLLRIIDLLHLLRFLRLQHVKHVFVYLVHVLFVRDGGDDFPAGDGGDCAEVDDVITFGAP